MLQFLLRPFVLLGHLLPLRLLDLLQPSHRLLPLPITAAIRIHLELGLKLDDQALEAGQIHRHARTRASPRAEAFFESARPAGRGCRRGRGCAASHTYLLSSWWPRPRDFAETAIIPISWRQLLASSAHREQYLGPLHKLDVADAVTQRRICRKCVSRSTSRQVISESKIMRQLTQNSGLPESDATKRESSRKSVALGRSAVGPRLVKVRRRNEWPPALALRSLCPPCPPPCQPPSPFISHPPFIGY